MAGVYTGDDQDHDQNAFVTEMHTFYDLLDGISSPCASGKSMNPWKLESYVQVWMVHCVANIKSSFTGTMYIHNITMQ